MYTVSQQSRKPKNENYRHCDALYREAKTLYVSHISLIIANSNEIRKTQWLLQCIRSVGLLIFYHTIENVYREGKEDDRQQQRQTKK